MRLRRLFPVIAVTLVLALSILPLSATARRAADPEAKPGPGVSQVVMLSTYFQGLADTAGDTPVYILSGSKPGPTVLILGGTHGDEIAGAMTALLIVERARVECGRLIVVPRANNSASTNFRPDWPEQIELKTPSGTRTFRYGSRLTHPRDEAANPDTYVHNPIGQEYVLDESRDLNRNYPGKADGSLTQKIAYGITQLVLKEKPVLSVDFHEAPYAQRGAQTLFIHPKCNSVADKVITRMATKQGIYVPVEERFNVPGMSNREWGDSTPMYPFTIESSHPSMVEPAPADRMVNDAVSPLWFRVWFHVTVMQEILDAYGAIEGTSTTLLGLPSKAELKSNGLGAYFN